MVAFLVVVGKLIWLHVIVGPDNAAAAKLARTNVVSLAARRGTIYDRNGNALATSVDAKTVYCNPKEIEDAAAAAKFLSEDLGGDTKDYLPILGQDTSFAYLYQKADVSKAEHLKEHLDEAGIRGIYFLNDMRRVYPYGRVAAQVLGFVNADGEGASGLELQYNDILQGENGEMIMELGEDGTPIAGGTRQITEAKDGADIVISIDVNIQQLAEDTLEQGIEDYSSDSGSVMVTDPGTGEILAICSTPYLDPDDATTRTDEAMKLRLVSDSYEPGSIFKVLTVAIGMEKGVFAVDTPFYVPAQIQVGDDTVTDDDDRDWDMDMDTREIIRRSSNVGAVLLGQKIGAEDFSEGLTNFGIGTPTGIDFPGEAAGIVTPLDEWGSYTLGAMSFGQAVAMPMDQMVRAVGAIANGGILKTPHLLLMKDGEQVAWNDETRVISKETAAAVTDLMCTVVAEGTGTNAQVEGYKVAGKTGTGEMVDIVNGGYLEGKLMSSMIGFANAGDARVLVYVGLNGTALHASDSSALLFSTIMAEALSDMDVVTVSDSNYTGGVSAVDDGSYDADSYTSYDGYDAAYSADDVAAVGSYEGQEGV